ncbi:hypothetical protein [Methylosinus sp. Sm6]|uniref:hypothetical protein n=1 Tax=Methylosinus sp. Sm6 TaxID=2866948 RepID=UPI001C9A1372|nr:hypothetical protein [Methylosinus sp. Sm6]MBY6239739.1 hypothetical protein [Methylosinus sp. Sm6]
MARPSAAPSSAEIEKAKLLYDAGVEPVRKLRDMLGMSDRAFRAFRVENGWPLRESPIKHVAEREPREPASKPTRSLIARFEEAVEREFARAETALRKGGPKSVEQSARVLASLVRSLAELKRMSRDAGPAPRGEEEDESGADASADEPPRELAELREELARRLERLRGRGPAE